MLLKRWWLILLVIFPVLAQAQDGNTAGFIDQLGQVASDNWKGIAGYTLKAGASMIGWVIAFSLLGLIVGIVLWLFCRRRGWLSAPWSWYRYVGWLWLPIIVLNLIVAFASFGFFFSASRISGNLIKDLNIVEQVGAQIYLYGLQQMEGMEALSGEESRDEIVAHLKDADATSPDRAASYAKLTNLADDFIDSREEIPDWAKKPGKWIAGRFITPERLKALSKNDSDAVFVAIANATLAMEDDKSNPKIAAAMSVINVILEDVEKESISGVKSVLLAQGWGALGMGFLISLGLVVVFRLIVRVGGKPPAVQPGKPPA